MALAKGTCSSLKPQYEIPEYPSSSPWGENGEVPFPSHVTPTGPAGSAGPWLREVGGWPVGGYHKCKALMCRRWFSMRGIGTLCGCTGCCDTGWTRGRGAGGHCTHCTANCAGPVLPMYAVACTCGLIAAAGECHMDGSLPQAHTALQGKEPYQMAQ